MDPLSIPVEWLALISFRIGVWVGFRVSGIISKDERCRTAINFISFAELKEERIINLKPSLS